MWQWHQLTLIWGYSEFKQYLQILKQVEPEVIFWEPINARGTNGKRMLKAGLTFAQSIMDHRSWAQCFVKQWIAVERAAEDLNILDSLYIWPDRDLASFVTHSTLEYWWYRPTPEKWRGIDEEINSISSRPKMLQQLEVDLVNC